MQSTSTQKHLLDSKANESHQTDLYEQKSTGAFMLSYKQQKDDADERKDDLYEQQITDVESQKSDKEVKEQKIINHHVTSFGQVDPLINHYQTSRQNSSSRHHQSSLNSRSYMIN